MDVVGNESDFSSEVSATPEGIPVWYVNGATGADVTNNGAESAPFATIQRGITATIDGDTVSVAAGTYVENIDFNGKNIVVLGENRETTIIDGDSSGSVVTFESGEDTTVVLSGFTIQNGNDGMGGGIYCQSASPTLENLVITNNNAGYGGGVCQSGYSDVTFENVEISGNTATYKGAAIYHYLQGSLTIINSTIGGNSGGVGAYYASSDDTELIAFNSIFWNTGLYEIYLSGASYQDEIARVGQCLIEGGTTSGVYEGDSDIYTCGSIAIGDPAFADTTNGDYHLSAQSAAISAGVDQLSINNVTYTAPATDMDGISRPNPSGTTLDLGAYEHENGVGPYDGPVWYVNGAEVLPYGNGSSSAPYSMIGPAIGAAENGDTVHVAAGTYVENINFNGKNIALIGENRETTIIDGNQSGSVVTFESGEDSTAVLSGFTIQNGSIAGYGGGINIDNYSNPTLTNVTISGNEAHEGGGMRLSFSDPTLTNVTISGNTATNIGGGMYLYSSSPTLTDVTFSSNTASGSGGGMYLSVMCNPILTGVTFSSNTADNNGGGMWLDYNSNPTLTNSILWDNSPQEIYFYETDDPNSITITYSDIQGGQDSIVTNDNGTVIWGDGNIDADPLSNITTVPLLLPSIMVVSRSSPTTLMFRPRKLIFST